MKWICFFLLAVVSNGSFACTAGPRDPGWADMLASARGAVIVRVAEAVSASNEYTVFRLERVETIADPQLLFRGKVVVGAEAPFENPDWHDRMPFWTGLPAGGVRNGSCALIQRIDPKVLHVLLLGVDGPYALEPIAPEGDRWLGAVRAFYAKPTAGIVPKILLPDLLRQIAVVDAGGCPFDPEASTAIENFLGCIRRVGRSSRIPVTLLLDQKRRIEVIATGEEPFLTRQELINELKTDFGWPEKIPLRSLLDGSLSLAAGTVSK